MSLTNVGSKLFQFTNLIGAVISRNASKKAGGSTRNKRTRTKGKSRGLKKWDGDQVEKGMILARQLGLKFYPGQNVGCGRDLTLFALEKGEVMWTVEKLTPYPYSPLYPATEAGRIVKKLFVHVLSEPQHQNFKLVSLV